MSNSQNLRGIGCMLLAALLFIACDSNLKLLLLDLPPLETLAMRGVFATLAGVILNVALGFGKDLPRAFGFWNVARTFAEVTAVIAFIFALAHAPIADVTAIYQIAPLILLAGASFLYSENVGLLRWALIAVGLAGALLVAQPGGQQSSPYLLLSFVTAFASAGRDLLTRKVPNDLPGPVAAFGVCTIVFFSTLLCSLVFETWVTPQPAHYVYAAAAGGFVMVAHMFIFLAFRFATARAVAPFYYSVTFFAVLAGAFFFHEYPNNLSIVGMALIVVCGLGVLAADRKERTT